MPLYQSGAAQGGVDRGGSQCVFSKKHSILYSLDFLLPGGGGNRDATSAKDEKLNGVLMQLTRCTVAMLYKSSCQSLKNEKSGNYFECVWSEKVVSSWRRRIKAGLMVAVAAPGGRHTSCQAQASLQQIGGKVKNLQKPPTNCEASRKGEKPPKVFNKSKEGEKLAQNGIFFKFCSFGNEVGF